MTEGGPGALSEEQLKTLSERFEEGMTFSSHVGMRVEKVEPGRAVVYADVEEKHLNGNGTLHGGVYATLIDNAMGLSVSSLVGLRTATMQMNVHFVGSVKHGRLTCRGEVVHRSRHTATAVGKVYGEEDNLLAMGTGAFRVFERRSGPIV